MNPESVAPPAVLPRIRPRLPALARACPRLPAPTRGLFNGAGFGWEGMQYPGVGEERLAFCHQSEIDDAMEDGMDMLAESEGQLAEVLEEVNEQNRALWVEIRVADKDLKVALRANARLRAKLASAQEDLRVNRGRR